MPGVRPVLVINNITVILLLELSPDKAAIGKVTQWLQERERIEGILLNHRKSQTLLADGVEPKHLTEEQRTEMNDTGLTAVRQGMRVLGAPVGT